MERLAYGLRARKRICQETLASARGRIVPLVVSIVGIGVGYIYATELHQITAWQTVVIAMGSGISANIIWVFGVLIVNTVRVPWLLDVESGHLIDTLEGKVKIAEAAAQDKRESQQRQELFGSLMSEGEALRDAFNGEPAGQYDRWLQKRRDWVEKVSKAFCDIGLATEAAAFRQAENVTLNVQNETQQVHVRRLYKEQMRSLQAELTEIVRRKLS